MFDRSIIKKSGQWWKAMVGFYGTIIGSISLVIGVNISMDTDINIILVLAGILIGLGSLAFGCLAIRCPACKARWVWMAVKEVNSKNWLHWLLALMECPKCKDPDLNSQVGSGLNSKTPAQHR